MSQADQTWKMINQVLNRSSVNNNIKEIKIGNTTLRGKDLANSSNNDFAI